MNSKEDNGYRSNATPLQALLFEQSLWFKPDYLCITLAFSVLSRCPLLSILHLTSCLNRSLLWCPANCPAIDVAILSIGFLKKGCAEIALAKARLDHHNEFACVFRTLANLDGSAKGSTA